MQIIWTNLVKLDYWENIEYLKCEWTLDGVFNFMDKTDQLLTLLSKQNLEFKSSAYKNVFQVPVVKQITLFYCVLDNNDIQLLRFWNTHQNPNKFKF